MRRLVARNHWCRLFTQMWKKTARIICQEPQAVICILYPASATSLQGIVSKSSPLRTGSFSVSCIDSEPRIIDTDYFDAENNRNHRSRASDKNIVFLTPLLPLPSDNCLDIKPCFQPAPLRPSSASAFDFHL